MRTRLDPDRLRDFARRLFGHLNGAVTSTLVYLGDELGLYRALAPSKQVYKPTEWNRYQIELRGSRLKVTLNGEQIQDADLSAYSEPVKRHNGSDAPPLKERPRKGHIGFQELSRGGDHVMIRNARIKTLD